MLDRLRFSTLQTGLVLFWAAWLSLVAATNLFDALKHLGILSPAFSLASYNFELVKKTVGAHGVPATAAAILFAGVVAWEFLASVLFWRAWVAMNRGLPGTSPAVTQAFAVSLGLWAAFLVATEATVDYTTAATHKGTLVAQLATLLVVRSEARV